MGVRSPSDSTDGAIYNIIYTYYVTGLIYPEFDHTICILYYQVVYVQIEHQDYSVYSLIIS